MHLVNAVAWVFISFHLMYSVDSGKFWIAAIACACFNIAWEFFKEKAGTAAELKNLPRSRYGCEVMTEVKLEDWYSVIQSAERCLLVRSRQKLPKRFTTGDPAVVSVDV